MRRLLAVAAMSLLLGGCASLPSGYERVESHALHDTARPRSASPAGAMLQAHPGQSGFRPLPSGVDALVARMHPGRCGRALAGCAVLHLA